MSRWDKAIARAERDLARNKSMIESAATSLGTPSQKPKDWQVGKGPSSVSKKAPELGIVRARKKRRR